MTQPAVIDIHAHFFPEKFLSIVEQRCAQFGGRVERTPKGPALLIGDTRTPPLDATYWDLDRRVKAMNRARVDVHALSLTAPMVYWTDADVGDRKSTRLNSSHIQKSRMPSSA